jgi:Protein of unknown function (DUF2844)
MLLLGTKIALSRIPMRGRILAGLIVLLALPVPAFGALGGNRASIAADRDRFEGTLTVTATERYVVHEITLPTATVVREYVSPAGTVFAVAWRGPWLPDMRVLLGTYFERYRRAGRARRSHRGPFAINEPDLVVRSAGHMRAFLGQAYLPALLPEGVRVEDLR